jgi:hypothetical protein
MKPTDRQKVCTHCDGRIPLDALQCPYCSAVQAGHGEGPQGMFKNQSLQDSLTSLYSPPYSSKGPGKPTIPQEEKRGPASYDQAASYSLEKEEVEDQKKGLWPILLLSMGGNLLTLGLLQLFFSSEHRLTLEWNSGYWYLYCLLSAPLIYLGFRRVNQIK